MMRWLVRVSSCVLFVGLVGCGSGMGPAPSPVPAPASSVSVRPSPSPSLSSVPSPSAKPTPSPSSKKTGKAWSKKEQAVVAKLTEYIRVMESIGRKPKADIDKIYTVAREVAAQRWQAVLMRLKLDERRFIGSYGIDVSSVTFSRKTRAEAVMCLDLTKTDVLEKNGVSAREPDAVMKYQMQFELRYDSKLSKWFVVNEKVTGGC